MSGVSESNVSSQASRGNKRKWVPEEDAALVSCMVDLHNVGTFNADTEFKAGYLNELERMLQKVLPNAMLKAKPNIESRIRLLKREWSIVYDMLNGQNNSGFGWDEHRQLVVAEDAVWESYLKVRLFQVFIVLFLPNLWLIWFLHFFRVTEKPLNSDIVLSLTTTSLLPYTQEIEQLGKMLKQLLMFSKK